MELQQDSGSLLQGLLAHLKQEAETYGISAPTPFKKSPKPRRAGDASLKELSPVPQEAADGINASEEENKNVAMPTIMNCKIRNAGVPQAVPSGRAFGTPFPVNINDSPMQYEQFTGLARATLIDDLSDTLTPKKLVYTDSPSKENNENSQEDSFAFDIESCCLKLDAVGLDNMPTTPYIGKPAAQPAQTPQPCKPSEQDLLELSNMLVQERAEKLALAAYNAELEEELAELKKKLQN